MSSGNAYWSGKTRSKETKDKISLKRRGISPWNKGLPHMSGVPKPWKKKEIGTLNSAWKGDNVGYRALHEWVERKLGKPPHCSNCGKLATAHGMHWANKSHNYLREITDWIRLCTKCHSDYDRGKISV